MKIYQEMKKALISVQVPVSLKEKLAGEAAAQEMDLSKLCRRILKTHVAAKLSPEVPTSTGEAVPAGQPEAHEKEAA